MKHVITACSISMLISLLLQPVYAHSFHYQVNVSPQWQTDSAGKLTAVAMDWDYDPQVTSIMLEGEDLSPEHQAQTLQALTTRLIKDLAAVNYFTALQINDETALFNEPTDIQLRIKAVDHAQRLQLHLQLPLQVAGNVLGKRLTLTLADPSGTGILTYPTADQIPLPSAWHDCQLQVHATDANEKPVPNEIKLDCTSPL